MITEELVDETAYEAAFWMAGIYSPLYPLEEVGGLCAEVQPKIRALACYRLLKNGSTDAFYHNLIRSARTRRHYLRRCIEEGAIDEHFRGCGRYQGLCDAIAANDMTLAREIVNLSPEEFKQGHEYEDDYCYGRCLSLVVAGRRDEIPPVLARLSGYLEGSTTGRFLVAEALAHIDQAAFDLAFPALLEDRKLEIAAAIKRREMESPHILAARRIFIEGLAILRLAEHLGLRTEPDYLFCPSLARAPMEKPFPGE